MKLEKPLLIFDTETTGVDTENDRIVQLAMIKVYPDGKKETKETLINPLISIPKGSSDVHGILDEHVKDAPAFKQLSKGILSFMEGCDLITFNGNKFDIPLLYAEFARVGIDWDYKQHRFLDAFVIFKRNESRGLESALKFYCNEVLEGAHSALADTEATLKVFMAQLERYEELPKEIDDLHLYCNYDKELIDLKGCFELDEDNDFVFTFGKYKGEKAKDCQDYLNWMLKPTSGFSNDTKLICKQILDNK